MNVHSRRGRAADEGRPAADACGSSGGRARSPPGLRRRCRVCRSGGSNRCAGGTPLRGADLFRRAPAARDRGRRISRGGSGHAGAGPEPV